MLQNIKIATLGLGFVLLMAFGSIAATINHFGKTDGLPNDAINFTIQDKDDYLWIGTHSGLYSFDGITLQLCKNNDLRKANITAGYLDNRGFIWIGTSVGEIFVYDGLKFDKIEVPLLQKSPIIQIISDTKGKTVVITKNNEIVEYVTLRDFKSYDKIDAESLIYSAQMVDAKTILVGTESGLKKIVLTGNRSSIGNFNLLPNTKVTHISKSNKPNVYWISTEDQGIYEVDVKGNGQITRNFSKDIRFPTKVNCLYEDEERNLWIGAKEQGVVKITFQTTSNSIINIDYFATGDKWDKVSVTDIFKDREGNTWVSTFDDGLLKFENEIFPLIYGTSKLPDGNVFSLARDPNDNFWIGTGSGLYQLNFNESKWNINDLASRHLIPADKITALNLDSNTLYVGTAHYGLYILNTQKNTVKKLQFQGGELANSIKCIDLPTPDELWVGTVDGVFIVNLNTNAIRRITTSEGLPHNNINDIEHSPNGRIWIATTGNRVAFYENNKIGVLTDKKFDITDINSICNDLQGNIWFASNGHGLFKFNGKAFDAYNKTNGLSSDFCYSVSCDPFGKVWVSHQQGLSRVEPSTHSTIKYVGFFGNTSFEFTVNQFLKGDQKMWLCTDKGVLRYSELNERLARQKPKIIINSVKIDSIAHDPRSEIILPAGGYNLTFEYSGLSLKNPAAVRYKVILKGYDKDWSQESPNKSYFKSSVQEGEYEFKVMACNEFGIWNVEPASIRIIIKKPFWKEWWAISMLFAGIFFSIYLFISIRTRRLLADKKRLEDLIAQRTRELELRNQQILENKDQIEKDASYITDSIKYAKRIQKAIYPTISQFKRLLPDSFVFFKSKGIVSGDFYWIEEVGSKVLFAACDCTGHGVPGAFISIVTSNLLNQAVKEHGITKPSLILDEVSKGVTLTLHQTVEDSSVKDGMDAAMCCYDRNTGILEFAGAYNSIFLFRDGELIEYKADSFPVGRFIGEAYRTFTNHEIETKDGDVIYLFSDGYADQFGGPDGKKIKKTNFRKLLTDLKSLPMEEQREKLYNYFKSWQGELEQVDDVLVIGVRIKR